jgi:hypothetical protein
MSSRSTSKKANLKRKTKKQVFINPNFNEIIDDKQSPITESKKAELWTTRTDEKIIREQLKRKKEGFSRARKEAPVMAAMTARRKFNIKSPRSSPKSSSEGKETWQEVRAERKTKKGIIPIVVDSVFRLFGKKGGRKTRKVR